MRRAAIVLMLALAACADSASYKDQPTTEWTPDGVIRTEGMVCLWEDPAGEEFEFECVPEAAR